MGLLLGGSVLTVFELIDLIVFRFINTLFAAKEKEAEQGVEAGETAAADSAAGRVVHSPRSPERPVSAVSTINTTQRRIRRIATYQPPTTTDGPGADATPSLDPGAATTLSLGPAGRPAIVVQTKPTSTSGGMQSLTILLLGYYYYYY